MRKLRIGGAGWKLQISLTVAMVPRPDQHEEKLHSNKFIPTCECLNYHPFGDVIIRPMMNSFTDCHLDVCGRSRSSERNGLHVKKSPYYLSKDLSSKILVLQPFLIFFADHKSALRLHRLERTNPHLPFPRLLRHLLGTPSSHILTLHHQSFLAGATLQVSLLLLPREESA